MLDFSNSEDHSLWNLKNPTVSAVDISSGGAQGELSRCQQMLCDVLFITYPGEKGLYHYTLSNGRQQLETATSQLPWCGSYRWYLDPFTKPQTRTPHISSIKTAAYFRCCLCTSLSCGCNESIFSHVSCVPPSCIALIKERGPVALWVLLRVLRLLEGCLPNCLWIGGTLLSHSSCSRHSGPFSWIKRDLLTRKRKHVDWPESRHKNIYCCWRNVENAAVLNMKRERCHEVSLSFEHHHHF